MENKDDWYKSPDISNNSQFNNRMVIKSKRKREMGIFSWLGIFALMGNFGIILQTMVLFNVESYIFCNMVLGLVKS